MKTQKNNPAPPEAQEPAPPDKLAKSVPPVESANPEPSTSPQEEGPSSQAPQTTRGDESLPETPPPARPSLFRRFTHWLLSADTPVGRVVRRVLRAIAISLALFAAGMLAFYFLFFRPQASELDTTNQTLRQRDSTITTQQMELTSRQAELSAAQQQITKLNQDLRAAQNQNGLIVLLNDVAVARMELALKNGASTLESIDKARKDLDTIFAFVNEKDPKAAAEIKSRLELMSSVLVRDAQLAKSDMDNLYTALLAIYDQLFKK